MPEVQEIGKTDDATFIAACRAEIGADQVVTGPDMAPYLRDWTGKYEGQALAVLRPRSTEDVAKAVSLCADRHVSVVPQGGRTGLCGGGVPMPNARSIILSLERMRTIHEIDEDARTMTLEAGVVLEAAQDAASEKGLVFPLTFGAQGSCVIGGALATNAGGSNVVRFGTTRELCLGLEAVLPDGSIVSDLAGLRKNNTGYDLRHLLIGSEGTLGIVTKAVFRLSPAPKVQVAAFLSLASLEASITALNVLQDFSGGGVEAFEYLAPQAVSSICTAFPDIRPPLEAPAEVGVFVEVASSRQVDATLSEDGTPRLQADVFAALEHLMEEGLLLDAMIAQSEQQRQNLWTLRESVLEAMMHHGPFYPTDVSLPLSKIPAFLRSVDPEIAALGFVPVTVGHLGDGNLHYALTAAPGQEWSDLPLTKAKTIIHDRVAELGGSFSAEHGIGQDKLQAMRRYKQASQLRAMSAIKRALDPLNTMNPGKLLPSE